jgi:thiamine biosynthesis lipoprotein ApbE
MKKPNASLGLILSLLAAPWAAAQGEPVPHAAEALRPQPIKLAIDAFGKVAEIEVRDLPREPARMAIEEALREIHYVAAYSDPDGTAPGGFGQLNRTAGQGEQEVERRAFDVLVRGLQFCVWSGGVYSPLGGGVYRLWREQASPYPADLQAAAASTACRLVKIAGGETGKPARAVLAAGSRLDAAGLAEGVALDRAADLLVKSGVRNALLSIGRLHRGIGTGAEGRGWLVDVPALAAGEPPVDQVWLVDQSLSVTRHDDAFRPLDLRSGQPTRGNLQVTAVAERAADAQGLTTTLFVLSQTKGQQHLGALQPRPSVHWLTGLGGGGAPVESAYRWTSLSRPNSAQ